MNNKSFILTDKTCRICPSEQLLVDLYLPTNFALLEILNLFINVEDENTTKLPKFICKTCKYILETIIEFKTKCKSRDFELREKIKIFEENDLKIPIKTEELTENTTKEIFLIEEVIVKEEINDTEESELVEKSKNHNPCHFCEKVFSTRDKLNEHKRMDHLQCPVCLKTFTTYQLMSHHKRNIHAGDTNCHICGKHILSRAYLAEHIRKDHNNERNHRCDICGKEFFHSAKLKVHLSTHNKVNSEICDFENCGKSFKSIVNLKQHKRTHFPLTTKRPTVKRPAKTIICQCCGKVLKTNQGYITHMRGHRNEKPFDCKDCDKKFRDQSSLAVHRRTHDNIRPFQCDLCPKSFYVLVALKNHKISIHETEMKHACHICGKRTKLKNSLNLHMKTHGIGINKNELN